MPTPLLLTLVYKMNGLVKSGCLKIGISISHFLSSFHALSISGVQQFLNLIEIISLSGLAIYPNLQMYFLKKPTTSKNPLSFDIVIGLSNASIASTLPGSGIVSSAEIRWPNNFILDLVNSHFSILIFNSAYFSQPRTQSRCLTYLAILLEYITTSSKYTITNSSKKSCRTCFINR